MQSIYLPLAAVLLSACASAPTPQDVDAATRAAIASSFRAQGIAGMDRLANLQNQSNQACSEAMGQPLEASLAKAIEEANQKTVRPPADGRYVGDWREGERIAQNGRGLTWTDAPGALNGGSCHNCHQIGKAELSFGSIGPSLYQYGRLRGVADPAAPDSRAIVEYTWGKLWNAKGTNACSGMPRFGHAGILNEQQLRDVMALLLDPQSPVNAQ
ncbi:sulfur oxidation c-type cytochrome SoxX [Pseudorhodoferax sp. Leaf267]|uniref:sulfur oxidation c-type cytochrome SoxX n=1 Tax=Pseudorhodoferax sp. Leaf267 TaxID=1736316 RepID=UPI0006FC0DF2|nr:sulfur oxidation c-type cytochrome SoxX [Pseudorhodoferax sp. Leaf267]KQP22979.1 sulfur oxidation c-type cytochrome SoxX [Pseudorhodoferax sp. Leaf267]